MNSETDKHSFQVFCFTFCEFSLFATTVKEGSTEEALGTSSRKLAEETLKRSGLNILQQFSDFSALSGRELLLMKVSSMGMT